MFDLGWAEMAIIMLVALIVIGPKDLPKVARTIGQWTGKARALARDFQRSLDDMAREAELDEIKKSIDRAGSLDFKSAVKSAIDPDDELERAFDMEDKPRAKPGASKPGVKKSSNVRKPAAAPARLALPDAPDPTIQPTIQPPGTANGGEAAAVSAEKAPAAAGADEARAPAAAGADEAKTSRG
jgi:sec-independent protein translocase protein TatB